MTDLPPTWRWRDEPVAPGPCVIVDIDGVLSDANHRQHLVKARRWDDFFEAAAGDPAIAESAVLLRLLDEALVLVLLTGRPWRIRDATQSWLEANGVRWDLLVMKRDRDFRPASEAKREAVHLLRERGFQPLLALDDEPGNVRMYEAERIPCVYFHSGYYET